MLPDCGFMFKCKLYNHIHLVLVDLNVSDLTNFLSYNIYILIISIFYWEKDIYTIFYTHGWNYANSLILQKKQRLLRVDVRLKRCEVSVLKLNAWSFYQFSWKYLGPFLLSVYVFFRTFSHFKILNWNIPMMLKSHDLYIFLTFLAL